MTFCFYSLPMQAGNLTTKRRNISLFLSAAADYGVPGTFLFNPDDLAVQAHFYKYGWLLWLYYYFTGLPIWVEWLLLLYYYCTGTSMGGVVTVLNFIISFLYMFTILVGYSYIITV